MNVKQVLVGLLSLLLLSFVVSCVTTRPDISSDSAAVIKSEGPYEVGGRGPAGGWIIYDKGNNSDGWRYIEAAPQDQTPDSWRHKGLVKWGCRGISVPDARYAGIGDGFENTQAILAACDEPDIAARKCVEYRGGGKDDWFLPSKDELELIYAVLFEQGLGNLRSGEYWSSSETSSGRHAWNHNLSTGKQLYSGKHPRYRVRAVRVFKDESAETKAVDSPSLPHKGKVMQGSPQTSEPGPNEAQQLSEDEEFQNYQRISRLNAQVRQQKIREIIDFMDSKKIKYHRLHDFEQNYLHVPYRGMLILSDECLYGGVDGEEEMTVAVRFSSSLPSDEFGAYIFGSLWGRAFLGHKIFDITGHTFTGRLTLNQQSKNTVYHIHTSLRTLGYPFSQLRPYQDSRIDSSMTYVVPLRSSLENISQADRDHFFHLMRELELRM